MIPLHRFRHLHFVGVGGAGMAPLAAWHAARGFQVTGSDRQESSNFAWLRACGVQPMVGHNPEAVVGADLVIRTSAVGAENPEIAEAFRLGIPVVRRAEALGEATASGHALCISGTHGKTTTTLMLARILRCAGLRPCALPGGVPTTTEDIPEPGAPGSMVVEADEFDRTFLQLHPAAAIVTNLEEEHLDCYKDLQDLRGAFAGFLGRLPFHGYALLCHDDAGARSLAADVAVRAFTYGLQEGADYRGVEREDGTMDVHLQGQFLVNLSLSVKGRHNRLNALGALAMSHQERVDPQVAALALAGFQGARRRLERVGTFRGAVVYDDYAHHPTELAATLQALREAEHGKRILAVFQPHLYSRTAHFASGFAQVLAQADRSLVAPVYAARETPDQGRGSDAILEHGVASQMTPISGRQDALDLASSILTDDAWTVVFVGAGDVGSWGRELVALGGDKC